jgi:hypothetical protein
VAATNARDFTAVHDRLKRILEPYRGRLVVTKDGPAGMSVELAGLEGKPWGYVAGTRLGKSYVSFYLMPVYAYPEVVESMSPELRRRMQGKACFNFTNLDEPLMQELDALTAAGVVRFRQMDLSGSEGPHRRPRRRDSRP